MLAVGVPTYKFAHAHSDAMPNIYRYIKRHPNIVHRETLAPLHYTRIHTNTVCGSIYTIVHIVKQRMWCDDMLHFIFDSTAYKPHIASENVYHVSWVEADSVCMRWKRDCVEVGVFIRLNVVVELVMAMGKFSDFHWAREKELSDVSVLRISHCTWQRIENLFYLNTCIVHRYYTPFNARLY